MQQLEQAFQGESWQEDYMQNWSRLPLGLRRHLARFVPPRAFQQVLSDGSDEVLETFLENPHITQAEVLRIVDRARTVFLVEKVSRIPRWYSSHSIKRRLLNNPITPYRLACRILDYLPFVELQRVMANLDLSREVRNKARECFRKAFTRLSEADTKNVFLSTGGRVLRDLAALTPKDKRVLLELIQRSKPPRPFILNLARSHITPPEVLELIARRPVFNTDTGIKRALLANGKTPQKVKNFLKTNQ
ncbi:MAG: hypothetical protein ACLFVT_07645 [Syntrophobacteria bacterium]